MAFRFKIGIKTFFFFIFYLNLAVGTQVETNTAAAPSNRSVQHQQNAAIAAAIADARSVVIQDVVGTQLAAYNANAGVAAAIKTIEALRTGTPESSAAAAAQITQRFQSIGASPKNASAIGELMQTILSPATPSATVASAVRQLALTLNEVVQSIPAGSLNNLKTMSLEAAVYTIAGKLAAVTPTTQTKK